MACSQTTVLLLDAWGVAGGYGAGRPAAKEILRRLAAGKRAADPLVPLVRAQTPDEVSTPADPVPVNVPGFADVAGLERVVDDLFQQVERGGIGRILAGGRRRERLPDLFARLRDPPASRRG